MMSEEKKTHEIRCKDCGALISQEEDAECEQLQITGDERQIEEDASTNNEYTGEGNNNKTTCDLLSKEQLESFFQQWSSTIGENIIGKIEPQISALKKEVEELKSTLQFTSKYVQRVQSEQVKVLNDENEKLKDGITKKFEEKLLDEVIRQLDEAERTIKRLEASNVDEFSAKDVLQAMHEMVEDFQDMLQNRFKLTAYRTDAGNETEEGLHVKSKHREITSEAELDGKIVRTASCGYKDRVGTIYRPETVVVYEHKKSADITKSSSVADPSATDPPE